MPNNGDVLDGLEISTNAPSEHKDVLDVGEHQYMPTRVETTRPTCQRYKINSRPSGQNREPHRHAEQAHAQRSLATYLTSCHYNVPLASVHCIVYEHVCTVVGLMEVHFDIENAMSFRLDST